MEVATDLPGTREYPAVIKDTGIRADTVVCSLKEQNSILIIPYESRIEEQHVLKRAKYNDLVKQIRHASGVKSRGVPYNWGGGGFVATLAYDICKQTGHQGTSKNTRTEILPETTK